MTKEMNEFSVGKVSKIQIVAANPKKEVYRWCYIHDQDFR